MASQNDTSYFSALPEMAKLTSLILFLSILFSLIDLHLYYKVLLHVPIFQYINVSEIPLIAPDTAITVLFFLVFSWAANYFQSDTGLKWYQAFVFFIVVTFISCLYVYIAYRNDPIIAHYQYIIMKYWYWIGLPVGVIVAVFVPINDQSKIFFRKNATLIGISVVIWYAIIIALTRYDTLTTGKTNNVIVKFNRELYYLQIGKSDLQGALQIIGSFLIPKLIIRGL